MCFAENSSQGRVFVLCQGARAAERGELPVKNHKMLKVRFYQEEVTSKHPFFVLNPSLFHSVGGMERTRRRRARPRRKWKRNPGFIYRLLFRDKEPLPISMPRRRADIATNYTLEKRD
jgi:hypothetical protein